MIFHKSFVFRSFTIQWCFSIFAVGWDQWQGWRFYWCQSFAVAAQRNYQRKHNDHCERHVTTHWGDKHGSTGCDGDQIAMEIQPPRITKIIHRWWKCAIQGEIEIGMKFSRQRPRHHSVKNLWKSLGLNHTALNRVAGQKYCALSTQPHPHPISLSLDNDLFQLVLLNKLSWLNQLTLILNLEPLMRLIINT